MRIGKYLNSETVMDIAGDEYLVKDELGDDKNAKLIDLVALPKKENINFVTMGRMSVEKNLWH